MADRALAEQLDQAVDVLLAAGNPQADSASTLSSLMKIADTLREFPDDRFRIRLRRDLIGMKISSVTPFICVVDGAGLIQFMKQVFGADETGRHAHGRDPEGFVSNVRIGDSEFHIMSGESFRGQESTASFYLHTNDVDALYDRAVAAGAIPILPPTDQPSRARLAIVQDPFGNRWLATKDN
jgi:PhnB protein